MKKKTTTHSGLERTDIDSLNHQSSGSGKKMMDDFDLDALEGWKNSGSNTRSMSTLDRKFLSANRFKSKTFIGLSAALLVVSLSAYLFVELNSTSSKENPTQQVTVFMDQTEFTLPASIDTLVLLNNEKRIQIKRVISDQKKMEQNKAIQLNTDNETVDPLPEALLEPLPIKIEQPEKVIFRQKSAKEIILNDLKAVDYSIYRTKPTVEIKQIVLTGTPADLESGKGISNEAEIKQVQIPYMDYLSKTLLLINKGKWKQALQRFQEITLQYPEDVNARFYSGLCYFNLQNYSEASIQFSACLQLEFSNFNEESAWYLAQSNYSKGEKSDAKALFERIRDQKGFYAKQAEKMLKNW